MAAASVDVEALRGEAVEALNEALLATTAADKEQKLAVVKEAMLHRCPDDELVDELVGAARAPERTATRCPSSHTLFATAAPPACAPHGPRRAHPQMGGELHL